MSQLFVIYVCHSESEEADSAKSTRTDSQDLNPKWKGLTMNLLFDIYGAHEALKFGQLQREDYSPNEFMNDVKKAEDNVFGQSICTPVLDADAPRFALSFYPLFLINDDVFEVMACHYAVSLVVNSMVNGMSDVNGVHIRSVVVPLSICSRYDYGVRHQSLVPDVTQFMTSFTFIGSGYEGGISKVVDLAEKIESMLQQLAFPSKHLVILFDRGVKVKCVYIFECNDWSDVDDLNRNYYLSFDFTVSRTKGTSRDSNGDIKVPVVRCWLTFGVNQRLRFYPEYAVWILPHLFVRTTKMSAYNMLTALYGDEYKHGWRVSLDDPIFSKYYHIITQHEHVSNNYHRDHDGNQKVYQQIILRDHLEENLEHKTAVTLAVYLKQQLYDSDAMIEDVAPKNDVFENDSNICNMLKSEKLQCRNLKFMIMKFENVQCTSDSILKLDDCPHFEELVQSLRKFQEGDFQIDALNVIEFNVDSIIQGMDHLIKVHQFLSNEEQRQKIQKYFMSFMGCADGADCEILIKHSNRTRERMSVEEKSADPVHDVDTLCAVTAEAMQSAHCYLLHREHNLYRLASGTDSKFKDRFSTEVAETEQKVHDADDGMEEEQAVSAAPIGINFGRNVLRWLPPGDSPAFNSLREEILGNEDSTIDCILWREYLMVCLAKVQGTLYTVEEMLGLKLYTDTNELQAALRRAHWTGVSLDVHKAYYQWTMGLYRTHLYYAVPIPTVSESNLKPCRLFHGLSRLFLMSQEMPNYFGPFSTTIAKSVASTFCNQQGLIWLLQSSYANPLKVIVGIDMDWISCFKHEREVLLYNQCLPIQKTETFDDDSSVLIDHFLYSLKSRKSPILKKQAFYQQLGVRFEPMWMSDILQHGLLFEETECDGMTIAERLIVELNVPITTEFVNVLVKREHKEGDIINWDDLFGANWDDGLKDSQ